jgi:hypothetical protein
MSAPAAGSENGGVIRAVRRWLLVLLAIGLAGTAADLVLLAHYEDAWQLPPLVLAVGSLVVVCWAGFGGGRNALTTLRIVMVLCVASGLAGIALHFNGNREFQHEIDPELGGWALVLKVMTAKAPPALAPAVMAQLGFLGLLYTYRHPDFEIPDIPVIQQEKS